MVFEVQWNTLLWICFFVFEVHLSISQLFVLCVSCFLKPGSHWRSFHVWRVRWSVPWSFSPRKAFVALGYGVVFVAHRKISFVSCMVGLPLVCSIWCVVWFFTFLGSRAVFIRCVLFEWIGVGVVLSPLHVKIGPGVYDAHLLFWLERWVLLVATKSHAGTEDNSCCLFLVS